MVRALIINTNDPFSNESENPYRSPASTQLAREVHPEVALDTQATPPNPGKVFFKWLLVCSVSAAPSFFWGAFVHQITAMAIVSMTTGVMIFVIGYTLFELSPYAQRLLRNKPIRHTARIGYGTRIAMSVIFPIGLYMDLFVGMLSTPATIYVFPNPSIENSAGPYGGSFFAILFHTIVQGILLNILLFAYMLIVFGFIRLIHGRRNQIDFRDSHASGRDGSA